EIKELKDSKNELVKEKKELEEKIKELTVFKEKSKDLAKIIEELLLDYSELSELEELLEKIKIGELNELNEVVMRIVEKWEIDAKTHFISFTETSKEFNDAQKAELREDSENKARQIEEKSKRLREAKDRINEQEL
ncbi:4277_t:CDS:2, partial [Paraglomus occultum]